MVYRHTWKQNRKPSLEHLPLGVMIRYEADSACGRYVYHLYKSSHNGGSYTVDTSYSGREGRDPRWVRVHGRHEMVPATVDTAMRVDRTGAIIAGPLGLAKEAADQLIAELDAEIIRLDAEAVQVPAEYPDHGTVTRGIDWTHEVPGSRTGERAPMDMTTIMAIEGSNWLNWSHHTYRLALDIDDRTDCYVDVTRNGAKVGIRLGWAYGPAFSVRCADLTTVPGIMRPSVETIQAWFSGVLRKARYLLDMYLQPIMTERSHREPSDGTDRDWEMGMSSFGQAIVDQTPTPETAAGMAGPADPETDDDDADPDPDPSPGPGRKRSNRRSNRKSVAEQARAYGWSEARYRAVISNISDRFRDPLEVEARSLDDLIELRRVREHYTTTVIPRLRYYIDIPLSTLRAEGEVWTAAQHEAHLTRIARLNLTRLDNHIQRMAWAPAKERASVAEPEPVLNGGSPILLYADAVRLEVVLTAEGTPLTRDHTGAVVPPVRGRPHISMIVKGWTADDQTGSPRYYGEYRYDDVTRATRDAADLLRGVATTEASR